MANDEDKDVNLDQVFSEKVKVSIDENERLRFAKWTLVWIAIICVGVFVWRGVSPDNKGVQDIFEIIKIGALPLITLIITFYFPNSK